MGLATERRLALADRVARVPVPLALGTALLFGVRLLLTLQRPGPVVLIDEVGYLTNARVLGGGLPAELLNTPFYRGGYSLLLAPLTALIDDPETAYRLILAANCVLAAALFPLLYALLTSCFRVSPRTAVWPAFVAAAYPSVTPTTGAAMSENLLLPLVVIWLIAFGRLTGAAGSRARLGWSAAFGASAAALWAVHGRMLVAVLATAAGLAYLLARRRLDLRAAAVGLLALGIASAGAALLNGHLIEENYGGRDFDEAGSRLSALDSVDGIVTVAGNALGQTWYLIVATLGLGLLLVLAERGALRRIGRRDASGPDLLLGLLLLAALGLIVVSALSFAEILRPDMLIYGRYAEVVAPPLLALGLVALARGDVRLRFGWLVGGVLALTAVVAVARSQLDTTEVPTFWNVQSLPLRSDLLSAKSLIAAGIAVTVVACLLVLVARRQPRAVAPLTLLVLLPTTALAQGSLMQRSDAVYPSGWASIEPALERARVRMAGYDLDRANFDGQGIYPWFAADTVITVFAAPAPPPSRYVISSASRELEHPGSRALWRDPVRDQALWELSGPAPRAGPAPQP